MTDVYKQVSERMAVSLANREGIREEHMWGHVQLEVPGIQPFGSSQEVQKMWERSLSLRCWW